MQSQIQNSLHQSNKPSVFLTLAVLCVAAAICTTHAAEAAISPSGMHENSSIKPGFNCAKGHSKNEKMICSDAGLEKIDYDLMLLYAQAKLLTHNSAAFRKTNNKEWLWREKNCSARECLLKWYAHRHEQLVKILVTQKASTPPPEQSETAAPSSSPTLANNEAALVSAHPLQPVQAISQKLIHTQLPSKPLSWIIGIVAVILIFFIREVFANSGQSRKRARIIAAAVRNNIAELSATQMELVADEPTGTHDTKKWDKEKRHFIEAAIKPALTDCMPLSATEADRLTLILDYLVRDEQRKRSRYKFRGYLDDSANGEYLHFCAQVLKDYGWKVRSARGGKPDAHLVADKNGLVIVAKCKSQSIPVGPDIIHEARSLRQQHKARKAVIVSNAPFATAAQKDAGTSGALLIHHYDLALLSRMVKL